MMRALEKGVARVLHIISGTWDYHRGKPNGPAFCDGLLIGSAPWLCYCCTRARLWLQGELKSAPRAWTPGQPMPLVFHTIHTAGNGVWTWPNVKWVYQTAEMEKQARARVDHEKKMACAAARCPYLEYCPYSHRPREWCRASLR